MLLLLIFLTFLNTTKTDGFVDEENSISTALAANESYVGTFVDVADFSLITISLFGGPSDADGTLCFEFSPDKMHIDNTVVYKISNLEKEPPHSIDPRYRYFRVKYTNGSKDQTFFRLQSLYHTHRNKVTTSPINNDTLALNTDADNVRAIVMGKNTAGYYSNVIVDADKSLGVNIVNPKTAFGEIKVAELYPLAQLQFNYGINSELIELSSNNQATAIVKNGKLELSTGTINHSFSGFISKEILKHDPGQGAEIRFTGQFDNPFAETSQFIGVGDSENALRFGYKGNQFGILLRYGGIDELWKLQITKAPRKKGFITITLDGTETAIPVDEDHLTVNVPSQYDDVGYLYHTITNTSFSHILFKPYYTGDGILFASHPSGKRNKQFLIDCGSTRAEGTLTKVRNGVSAIDIFIPQSKWNVDKADGTGVLPQINFQKPNIYKIQYQWLDIGMINFSIINPINSSFVTVHKTQFSNASRVASFSNSSMPLNAFTNNGTSGKNITLKTSAISAYKEGVSKQPITRFSAANNIKIDNTEKVILVLRSKYMYQGITSRIRIALDSISISSLVKRTTQFKMYRNPYLTESFTYKDINTLNSTVEYSDNADHCQIMPETGTELLTMYLAPDTTRDKELTHTQFNFVPGDLIVFTAKSLEGGIGDAYLSCTWVEDF